MSTTKEKLKRLIREALEEQQEDSILLERPELLKEEEGVLQSDFAENKPSEEVQDMLNRAEKLSPAELTRLYFDIQKMYLEANED